MNIRKGFFDLVPPKDKQASAAPVTSEPASPLGRDMPLIARRASESMTDDEKRRAWTVAETAADASGDEPPPARKHGARLAAGLQQIRQSQARSMAAHTPAAAEPDVQHATAPPAPTPDPTPASASAPAPAPAAPPGPRVETPAAHEEVQVVPEATAGQARARAMPHVPEPTHGTATQAAPRAHPARHFAPPGLPEPPDAAFAPAPVAEAPAPAAVEPQVSSPKAPAAAHSPSALGAVFARLRRSEPEPPREPTASGSEPPAPPRKGFLSRIGRK